MQLMLAGYPFHRALDRGRLSAMSFKCRQRFNGSPTEVGQRNTVR